MIRDIRTRFGIVGELFSFLWKRKLWWLLPLVVMLLVFSILLVISASGGPLAPFIYTLF